MRGSIATSLAIGGLTASWAIAFGSVAFQTVGNVLFLLLMLSLVFLLWGAVGFIVRNEGYFVSALGGQMAWSLCALSLLGNSVLVLWGAFFIHMVVITSGSRGMWLTIWLPSVNERTKIQLKGILRWNLLMALGWLGTAAAFSIMFFTATPWLVIQGGGLAVLMLLSVTVLVSFALLVSQMRGPGSISITGLKLRKL